MKKPKKEPTVKERVTGLENTSMFYGKLLAKLERRITNLESKLIRKITKGNKK